MGSTLPVSDGGSETTLDRFLGGRVEALQPRRGFRSANDAVLLAASIPARIGDDVLELGCGSGVGLLCLAARVDGLKLSGVDLNPEYLALASSNAARNGRDVEFHESDVTNLPAALRQRRFAHVFFNPPFFSTGSGTRAADEGRAAARQGRGAEDWLMAGARRLAPGGRLTLIQRIGALTSLLSALESGGLGSAVVLPLAAREGREADRFILQARKGGRASLRLLAPMVLHGGDRHADGPGGHSPEAEAVLRHAAATSLGQAAPLTA